MSRIYWSNHARIRMFERRGVQLSNEEEAAVIGVLQADHPNWPPAAQWAKVDLVMNGVNFAIFMRRNAASTWTITSVVTGRRQRFKTRMKKMRKLQERARLL